MSIERYELTVDATISDKEGFDLLDPITRQAAVDLIEVYAKARKCLEIRNKLQKELEESDLFQEYQRHSKNYTEIIEKAKSLSKSLLPDGVYTCAGFEFKKSTSNRATKIWDLEKIRTQKWAPAVIIEAVDEKVFKALAKTIEDPESYYTEESNSYPTYSMIKEASDE